MYLYTEVTSINVVAQEEVSCLCGVSSNLEELHQIEILAVDIPANGDLERPFPVDSAPISESQFRIERSVELALPSNGLLDKSVVSGIEGLASTGREGTRIIAPKAVAWRVPAPLYVFSVVAIARKSLNTPLQTLSCVLT